MASPPNSTKKQCKWIGSHTLDTDGDVLLVFNSKDAIVSNNLEVNLVRAGSQDPTDEDIDKDEDANNSDLRGTQRQAQSVDLFGTADIQVRVSSKHLALGSSVFRAILSPNFSEGKNLHKNGKVKIVLDDDPIDGMMVLLKLLHFKYQHRKMTPSLLMQVALLADKYDMATQILYLSPSWCDEIGKHVPRSWDPSVVSYIGLFSMLKMENQKKKMMTMARGYITENTFEHGLPIQHLIETLHEDRLAALDVAFKRINNIVNRYMSVQSNGTICDNGSHVCDAAMLGLLLQGLKQKGLWPLPSKPFEGITVKATIERLMGIDLASECTITERVRKRKVPCRQSSSGHRILVQCDCEGFNEIIRDLELAAGQ